MATTTAETLGATVHSREWTPELDAGRYPRARIGYVLIPSETTIEDDVRRLTPPGVGAHIVRAPMPEGCTVENLGAMESGLAQAASMLLPGFKLDVVCYACTSGSMVIGEETVIAELERGVPGRTATTLVTGCIEALRALDARRIVIGTPYLDDVNAVVADYFRNRGFTILDIQGMNLVYDNDISRVTPRYLREFAQAIDRPDADAVFISCGALRTLEVIDEIEQSLGKPAVCSNQAMIWHCLRLAGIDDQLSGYGRLFSEF